MSELVKRDRRLQGLEECVVHRCVVGSRAYGLEVESSDTDRRGFYLAPADLDWSLDGAPEQIQDWDLRGVHVLPAAEVLGLDPPRETIELAGDRGGAELDLVTHDARKFFTLMLRPNGYVLEQLLSPLVVRTTPVHQELCALAPRSVTRRHSAHYLGFATGRWRLLESERPPRVKTLLYLYRVLMTGIHLMRTGEVEANLVRLNQEFRLDLVWLKDARDHPGLGGIARSFVSTPFAHRPLKTMSRA